MGWTTTHLPYGTKITEYLSSPDFWGPEFEVLKTAFKDFSTVYMAVKRKHKDGDYVFAAIFMVSFSPKSYWNLGYKDMDETCGPYQCECPESILDLLTPTDNEYALRWRKNCREYHAELKAFNKIFKKVKPGWIISHCHQPEKYTGVVEDAAVCELVRKKRGIIVRSMRSGSHYKSARRTLRGARFFPNAQAYVMDMLANNDLDIPDYETGSSVATHRIVVGKAVYYPIYFDGGFGITSVASLNPGDPVMCDVGCVPWRQLAAGYMKIEKLPNPITVKELCAQSCPRHLNTEEVTTNE